MPWPAFSSAESTPARSRPPTPRCARRSSAFLPTSRRARTSPSANCRKDSTIGRRRPSSSPTRALAQRLAAWPTREVLASAVLALLPLSPSFAEWPLFQAACEVRAAAPKKGRRGYASLVTFSRRAIFQTPSTCIDIAAASPRTIPPPFSVSPIFGLLTCRLPASPRNCQKISAICATPVAPTG